MHTVVQLQGGGQDRRPEALLMTQDSLKQDVPTLMAKAPAMQELVAAIRPCPPHTNPPLAELEALGEEEEG